MKTCGLDVHKDIIFCAIYDGKVSVVKQFSPIIVQCAWSAVRVKDCKFQQCFQRLCVRKSAKKAIIAIARKILVTVYSMLLNHEEYSPNKAGDGITAEQLQRKIQYHISQTERLRRRMGTVSQLTSPTSNNTR